MCLSARTHIQHPHTPQTPRHHLGLGTVNDKLLSNKALLMPPGSISLLHTPQGLYTPADRPLSSLPFLPEVVPTYTRESVASSPLPKTDTRLFSPFSRLPYVIIISISFLTGDRSQLASFLLRDGGLCFSKAPSRDLGRRLLPRPLGWRCSPVSLSY